MSPSYLSSLCDGLAAPRFQPETGVELSTHSQDLLERCNHISSEKFNFFGRSSLISHRAAEGSSSSLLKPHNNDIVPTRSSPARSIHASPGSPVFTPYDACGQGSTHACAHAVEAWKHVGFNRSPVRTTTRFRPRPTE